MTRAVLYFVAILQALVLCAFFILALKFAYEQQWQSVGWSVLSAVALSFFNVRAPEEDE
jgi:asparagine N-glycosylation enzyme membrane subunit Stt3